MPKQTNISKILLIGSGPITIGQTGEYDYACSQACKALQEEGYEVVVINSNPATLMTDSKMANSIYIEPLTIENIEKVIAIERPEGLLAVFGGQLALNLSYFMAKEGILDKYQVKLLGLDTITIEKTEDRLKFREFLHDLGLKVPIGAIATNIIEGMGISQQMAFPIIIRSSFANEGAGVLVAYNKEELAEFIEIGLNYSPIHQVLIEESLYGWRELELEVIRDAEDRCMIVSSLENIDPVGVHSGNSAVVLPAQSLSASEYSNLVVQCKKVIKKLGVLGVINLQIAQNPTNDEIVILEVNPRFTRSSAVVSKATGFQIAGVVAKLLVGLTLEEVFGESAQSIEAFSQSTINYTAVKLPRFNFEKFPDADQTLGTTMKATGEVLAFGGCFKEAFQKAIRALMINRYGFGADGRDQEETKLTLKEIKEKISNPNSERWFYLRYALKNGMTVQEIANLSKLSLWFINELAELLVLEKKLTTYALYNLTSEVLLQAKQWGFSDVQIAYLLRTTEDEVRSTRQKKDLTVKYIQIEAQGISNDIARPYFFSSYNMGDHIPVNKGEKILIIGPGPSRIGQGAEYDYCKLHTALAITEMGYESIIINCNPLAISTDPSYTTKLYFEPLTKEDVLNVIDREEPTAAILQFGGRATLNLINPLLKVGIKLLGTSLDSFDRSTNWNRLKEMIKKLGLLLPSNGIATDMKGALEVASQIGYPVIIRPSYSSDKPVEILYGPEELQEYIEKIAIISQNNPLLIEKFLDDAIGIIVDCVADSNSVVFCGILEQIEEAGIHPGDCACALPPYSVGAEVIARLKENTRLLAKELQINGLLSVQYAIKHDSTYLLEVNPQAGLFMPFICKATGVDWVAVATKVMLGLSIKEQNVVEVSLNHTAIKEAVFSFDKFPGVDTLLGPEMRSTGAVMGIDQNFGKAFIKAQLAAGEKIPTSGTIFLSIRDEDKRSFTSITRQLVDFGFKILAVEETVAVLNRNNLPCQSVYKVGEGRPNIIDKLKNGEVQWIISTSSGRKAKPDEILVRRIAAQLDIPIITTVSGTQVAVIGLEQYLNDRIEFKSIQEYYSKI